MDELVCTVRKNWHHIISGVIYYGSSRKNEIAKNTRLSGVNHDCSVVLLFVTGGSVQRIDFIHTHIRVMLCL